MVVDRDQILVRLAHRLASRVRPPSGVYGTTAASASPTGPGGGVRQRSNDSPLAPASSRLAGWYLVGRNPGIRPVRSPLTGSHICSPSGADEYSRYPSDSSAPAGPAKAASS